MLLTNKDYTSMYNAALVVQEQLKAVGVNAELKVVDWPTSIAMYQKPDTGWNIFFSGWGTQPALGALATMAFMAPPGAQYQPKDGKDDPDLLAAWRDMNDKPTKDERRQAFGRMQQVLLERAYALAVRVVDQGAGEPGERGGLRAVPHPAHVQRVVHQLTRRGLAAGSRGAGGGA